MKGGGDAVSAARAVLQTGEYDYAWNMQVEDEILRRLEKGGKGRVEIVPSGDIEHIQLNSTDPWTEVDGERSSIKTKHPLFSDPAVRQALALLVDRAAVQKYIYGRTGVATGELHQQPGALPFEEHELRVQRRQGERAAGRRPAGSAERDGIRAKDGKQLKFVFQTSINAPRQKTQAIVKQACQKAGIEIELKAVTASVFFSSDVANPDTYHAFLLPTCRCTRRHDAARSERVHAPVRLLGGRRARTNKWQGRNITRWRNDEYDDAYRAAEARARPGQARGAVHPHERPGGRRQGGDPGRLPAAAAAISHRLHARAERVGQ